MKNIPVRCASALLLSVGLAACGGGDDAAAVANGGTSTGAATGSTGGGTLTVSAASPANYNGDIQASNAKSVETKAEAANQAISVPYCTVEYIDAPGPDGRTYTVKVYFLQGATPTPVNLSIGNADYSWLLSDFASTGLSGLTVDLVAKKITISNKAMTGSDVTGTTTFNGTVDGSLTFPAVAGCGA